MPGEGRAARPSRRSGGGGSSARPAGSGCSRRPLGARGHAPRPARPPPLYPPREAAGGRGPGRRSRPLGAPTRAPEHAPSPFPESAFYTGGAFHTGAAARLPVRYPQHQFLTPGGSAPSPVRSHPRSAPRPIPARPSLLGRARPSLLGARPASSRARPPPLVRAAGGSPPLPRALPPLPGRAPGRDGEGLRSPRGPVGVRKRPAPPPGHVRDPPPSRPPGPLALLDRARLCPVAPFCPGSHSPFPGIRS
ncbi:basic proline-rich protein-like [Sus scrofa]|uniref:basic proline-rich protein-like n=1 Tax=Sus scrofa TaxID=9823 RepID=UPI000A2B1122|nr:basic proline-rich protein-like [Sus scrofa]